MGLSFGNPLGFLALLGIPAVLAIHYLQRKSKEVNVTTLFLLEQRQRESEGGRRLERLRSSIPLWLQLLAVLVLTWLMAEPRWLERHSVQRMALVLDGSASMTVAREALTKALPDTLRTLAAASGRTEYYLLDSRMEAGHLYHGDSAAGLQSAIRDWQPSAGSHDPGPALRLARSLTGRDGTVLMVTDHKVEGLPSGARLYANGEPAANCGIAGIMVEETDGRTVWRATLRNYSTLPQTREWQVESGGARGRAESITLPPGGMQSIQSAFPDGHDTITVRLSPDKFSLDDSAPVLRPQPKLLSGPLPGEEAALPSERQIYQQVFESLPSVSLTTDPAKADVFVAHYNPLDPVLPDKPACVFVRDPRESAAMLSGSLLVERHPFTANVNWQSLLVQDALALPSRSTDDVLLWIGERPLLFLRGEDDRRQLCFNFDLRKSNARRLPAFIVAVHRFFEDARTRRVAPERRNVECAQKLRVAVHTGDGVPDVTMTWKGTGQGSDEDSGTLTVPPAQAALLTAPDRPCVLEVRQGSDSLLTAAAHFADVREADFSKAATAHDLDGVRAALVERFSREDASWRLWLLGLALVIVLSWWFIARPQQRAVARAVA